MITTRRVLIAGGLLVVIAGVAAVTMYLNRADAPQVDVERLTRRSLEAIVSASGTIEPERSVDISSSVMGRVTRLSVDEGDRVTAGQFLLEIDPESLRAKVNRGQATVEATESGLEQAQVGVETARVTLELARENFQRQAELWKLRLVSREVYDQARREVELRETEYRAREVEVATASQRIRQEQATLDSARYDLTQVTITSPIDGVVTRRNIEEGETVVIGTMNNAGTVLLTIADFSVLEAHVEVDETDIPSVSLGQRAIVTIDALPDAAYSGTVTEIGNSPIQETNQSSPQATNFKVVVTLDGDVPGVRPGFTATADITTATRADVVAVPIQSTTVRDLGVPRPLRFPPETPIGPAVSTSVSAAEPSPTRRITTEVEGVFVVRDNRVTFVPVDTGIAGDRYFEVMAGLEAGDLVVTGPFDVVRTLSDGDAVRTNELPPAR